MKTLNACIAYFFLVISPLCFAGVEPCDQVRLATSKEDFDNAFEAFSGLSSNNTDKSIAYGIMSCLSLERSRYMQWLQVGSNKGSLESRYFLSIAKISLGGNDEEEKLIVDALNGLKLNAEEGHSKSESLLQKLRSDIKYGEGKYPEIWSGIE